MSSRRLWLAVSLLLATACSREIPVVDAAARQRQEPWSPATVAAARAIPVQHEGRVKPFDTLAQFELYAIHGRRDVKFCWGEQAQKVTLSPTEWLLDVFFYPEQAKHYPLFRVDNAEVFRALWPGKEHAQKQDLEYVSYHELLPVGNQLLQMVATIEEKKNAKDMEPFEQALVLMRNRLMSYHALHQQFALLHMPYLIEGEKLRALFDGRERAGLVEVLGKAQAIAQLARELMHAGKDVAGTAPAIHQELSQLGADAHRDAALLPPAATKAEQEQWLTLGDLARLALDGKLPAAEMASFAHLATAATAAEPAQRETAIVAFQGETAAAAKARGEYGTVALEADYYARSWAYQSLHWFLTAFLVVACAWVLPRSRWLYWGTMAAFAVAIGYLGADITMRCVIRSRPPITNLYDTILFIAATGALTALVTELVTRKRIALSVGPAMGALLVWLARAFETADGHDTMGQLQAVLDSNHYLTIHVVTINLGYAAGMFAMLLGNVWLLARALGLWRNDPATLKSIVRMTYGATCFGLLFAVFGTIYGGVWANDSWGRFWGWDPKENGALLICLAQTALLHARLCGWVKDFGFSLAAGFIGIIVAFSWFGVNLMGVGLHSYGFAAGRKFWLFVFYGLQALLLGGTSAAIGLRALLARARLAALAEAKTAPSA